MKITTDQQPLVALRDTLRILQQGLDKVTHPFDELPIAILFIDRDCRLEQFTPAVHPLFDLDNSDLGRPLDALDLHFGDTALASDVRSVVTTGGERRAEVCGDNRKFYTRRVLSFQTGGEEVDGAVITLSGRDESIRAQDNESPVFWAFLDKNERFVRANRVAFDGIGFKPDQLPGQDLATVIPQMGDAAMTDRLEAVRRGHRVSFNTSLLDAAGQYHDADVVLVPDVVNRPRDTPAGFYMLIAAVGVREREQRTRTERRHALARSNRDMSMEEIADVMAHQLNQPLNALASYAGALKRLTAKTDSREAEFCDKISAQVQAASRIVHDLRRSLQQRASTRESVNLDTIVRRVLPLIENQLDTCGVVVETSLRSATVWINGSHVQIEQLLLNLIGNAADAMANSRQRRLTIRTRVDGAHVLLHVDDTGPGVAQAHLPQLFEPLFTTRANGRGMGLSICRRIAENHDGAITVESSKDGSRFTLRLPIPSNRGAKQTARA